jgi:hypothetical protein
MHRLVLTVAICVLAAASGCGKNIGDPCVTNVDCSTAGDRFCDRASPGGYCTVEGCDTGTCPTDDAVCIRFFTPVLTRPCTFTLTSMQSECRVDERCVCDHLLGPSYCENDQGHCAPEASERRWCMDKCNSDGDCRDGYICRGTGTLGADVVPNRDGGVESLSATFCAPRGS